MLLDGCSGRCSREVWGEVELRTTKKLAYVIMTEESAAV